jgi:hypothetical protein
MSIASLAKSVVQKSLKKVKPRKKVKLKEMQSPTRPSIPEQKRKTNRGKKQVMQEAKRKAKTADRTKKDQELAKKLLPKVKSVRKKVEGMSADELGQKFTGKELKAMEMRLKQASTPNKALLNKIQDARNFREGMMDVVGGPSKTPAKFRKAGGKTIPQGSKGKGVRALIASGPKGKQAAKEMGFAVAKKGGKIVAAMKGGQIVAMMYDD